MGLRTIEDVVGRVGAALVESDFVRENTRFALSFEGSCGALEPLSSLSTLAPSLQTRCRVRTADGSWALCEKRGSSLDDD